MTTIILWVLSWVAVGLAGNAIAFWYDIAIKKVPYTRIEVLGYSALCAIMGYFSIILFVSYFISEFLKKNDFGQKIKTWFYQDAFQKKKVDKE